MEILGKQFIAGGRYAEASAAFYSCEAANGELLSYRFYPATEAEIAAAAVAAADASQLYRTTGLAQRAVFLEAIAAEIDALDDQFIQVVMRETGLPEPRIRGERVRTTNQLRLFAATVRRGDFLGARINIALPERQPLARPDIRQYRIPLGPIAVFGASNFPLAFSVAGGDTASALAAGCPVVIKAHSGHPITSELTAQAVVRAVEKCRMPAGVFGMLFGDAAGGRLVACPEIKGVGFTGSLRGGRALMEIAARRPEPIPVFAEMSSVNPVIILPGALQERGDAIAAGLAASATLASGQFCTNPGLVMGCSGTEFDTFCLKLAEEMGCRPPGVMLTRTILNNYNSGVERCRQIAGVEMVACGAQETGRAETRLFRADPALLSDPSHPLEEELFGPATVVVAVRDVQELLALAPYLQGHLTASLFAGPGDLPESRTLMGLLESRVGRLIFNEYPTGLEVCEAVVHGGPWPATSDSRTTSVGTLAMDRFLRPVCYQGYPDDLLPPALQESNPLGLRRLVNGEWTTY